MPRVHILGAACITGGGNTRELQKGGRRSWDRRSWQIPLPSWQETQEKKKKETQDCRPENKKKVRDIEREQICFFCCLFWGVFWLLCFFGGGFGGGCLVCFWGGGFVWFFGLVLWCGVCFGVGGGGVGFWGWYSKEMKNNRSAENPRSVFTERKPTEMIRSRLSQKKNPPDNQTPPTKKKKTRPPKNPPPRPTKKQPTSRKGNWGKK